MNLATAQRLAASAWAAYDATRDAHPADQAASRKRADAAQGRLERLSRSSARARDLHGAGSKQGAKKARRNTRQTHGGKSQLAGVLVFCAGCGVKHDASAFQAGRNKCRFSERLPERGSVVHWTIGPRGECVEAAVLRHHFDGWADLEVEHKGGTAPVRRASKRNAGRDGWHLPGKSCPGF